jgi:hypothetical protein
MSDNSNTGTGNVLVIERRARRVGGRTTYWVHDSDPRLGVVQVNSDRAKTLVQMGLAKWAHRQPIVTTKEH